MIGHGKVRAALERDLPPVTLLSGPDGIGKWTLALHLADHHQVEEVDRFIVHDRVRVKDVMDLRRFGSRAPFGALKLFLLALNDASWDAYTALLKILEEPAPTNKFILVTSRRDLPKTLTSRARCYELGLLTPQDATDTLRAQGLSERAARRTAEFGAGQLPPPGSIAASAPFRVTVVGLMGAVAGRDRDLFDQYLAAWDPACHEALYRWLVEALTRQWNHYTEKDMAGLHRDRDLLGTILLRLGQFPRAQSRLAVRAALEPLFAT